MVVRCCLNIFENKQRTYQLITLDRKNGLTQKMTYDMFIEEFESSDPAFKKAFEIYQRDRKVYENEANRQIAKTKPQVEKTFGVRSQALKTAGVVLCIAGALIAVGTAAVAVYDLYKYYHKDYAPIPDKIVHESTDGQGRFVYTLYNCTPCNRKAQGFASDVLGDNGDMNGDVGLQWLALYTTKDKAAGAAITADIIAQKGSNQFSLDKPTGIRLFGKNDIVNIVSTEYCYNDKLGGLYIVSGNEIMNDAPTSSPR